MDKIRVILVDDEPLARERVHTLLASTEDFEIVAECEDGGQAIEAIADLEPDLIFLDVQMPEIDGFDVLLSLNQDKLPAVIFITAYDQYAVRAFDVHAIDYLLKPFDQERFNQALERARAQLAEQALHPDRHLRGLLKDLRTTRKADNRLLVKSEGRLLFLETSEIDWVEAAGNYVRIHQGPKSHLIRETMGGMENRLPMDQFVRIHRSTMVNFNRIKELHPAFNSEYIVVLNSGAELKLSRKYKSLLEERIGRSL